VLVFSLPVALYVVLSLLILAIVLWKLHALKKEFHGHSVINKELRFKAQMVAYIVIFIAFW